MSFLFRGLAFLARRPRLWTWIVTPAVIALLILIAVSWAGVAALDAPIDRLVEPLPDFIEGTVAGLIDALLVVLVVVIGYFVLFSLAAVIAAPFNETISEAIEAELTGRESPPFALGTFVRELLVGIGHALRRMAGYLWLVALLFAVGLVIPFVGPLIAIAGGVWLTVRAAAWEAMDAVFGRKGTSYADKKAVLRRHRGSWFGLGAGVALLMLVPGLNLITLSAGAAGATLLASESGEIDNSK